MKFDFDRIIDRTGTASIKWDLADSLFSGTGLLPLWVADMDFESPPEVIEALSERARHGIYGYTAPDPEYSPAIAAWFKDRHNWELDTSWLHFSPGVVTALNLLVQALTEPGDRVIVQKPVYYPFMSSIKNNGRTVLDNSLKLEGGRYVMDLDGLERVTRDPGARLLLLCNPHNPVGRAWTREELKALGDICIARGIPVVSDEIHCDLVYPGRRHAPFGSLGDSYLQNSITCISPSKTFNLAGLQTASLVIADPEIGKKYRRALERFGLKWPNLFGATALTAAYRHGADWLDQLMEYIAGNYRFLKEFIGAEIPAIRVIEPEATYLVWLDFRGLGLDAGALKTLLCGAARVALNEGYTFGSPEGDGFERINIACPRSILREALTRIAGAVRGERNAR